MACQPNQIGSMLSEVRETLNEGKIRFVFRSGYKLAMTLLGSAYLVRAQSHILEVHYE